MWNFLAASFKNSCFFSGEPLRVFHYRFFRCFYFTTDFYYCFFRYFHFTNFLYRDYFLSSTSFLCCCTANTTDLIELFLVSGVFHLALLPQICHSTASTTDLRQHSSLSVVFTLHSFPTFGTTWFYRGFPGSRQFFIEEPHPSVSLNYTAFSKKY